MDDSHFDHLARSLAVPSRRSLLASLATAIGAALFGEDGAEDAAAKRKHHKHRHQTKQRHRTSRDGLGAERRKKKKKKKKKTGTQPGQSGPSSVGCTPTCAGRACGDQDGCGGSCQSGSCLNGQVCQNGQCVHSCAVGTPCGPGSCISGFPNLGESRVCDSNGNCIKKMESCGLYRCREDTCPGSCTIDDHCMNHAFCQAGSCLPRRTGGETCDRDRQCEWGLCFEGVCCESACVAPPNARRTCAGGTCAFTCNSGFGNCDGDWSNGCEADLRTDEQHCGGCDQPCVADNATGTCTSGTCGYTCLPDYANCDGTMSNGCETDLTDSPNHCGACNRACGGTCAGAWECINRTCQCK
jgi:hypothetical protein